MPARADRPSSEAVRSDLAERALARFGEAFRGEGPEGVAIAPGRVNLIGEHTDYNDGFVLPMAIDRYVWVAFAGRTDGVLRAHSLTFEETRSGRVAALAEAETSGWFTYVAGVVWALARAGITVPGADLVVGGDLPVSSGLSSSAALELATARAIAALGGWPWDARRAAILCREAENDFVGVACGVMDQLAVALGRPDTALLLDCRSLDVEPIALAQRAAWVVMDTAAPRDLAGSAYNARRAACERVVAAVRASHPDVHALRDVTAEMLRDAAPQLDPVAIRRAQHVLAESARPRELADALRDGDLARAGWLLTESHWSLRDLYEVSSSELDLITAFAREHGACFGARLTGAGFGGCAVALVEPAGLAEFVAEVEGRYRDATGRPGVLFPVRAASGAALLTAT